MNYTNILPPRNNLQYHQDLLQMFLIRKIAKFCTVNLCPHLRLYIPNEHDIVYAFVEIHVGKNPHIIDNNIQAFCLRMTVVPNFLCFQVGTWRETYL